MSLRQENLARATWLDTGPYLRQEGRPPPGPPGEEAKQQGWSAAMGVYPHHRRPRSIGYPEAGRLSSMPGLPVWAAWLMDRIRQPQ
jgi:hypothetical protein